MECKTAEICDSDKDSTSPHPVGYVPVWPPKSKKPPKGTEARTVYTKYDIEGTFVSKDVRWTHGPRVPILFTPLSRDVTFFDVSSHDIRNQLAENADEMPPYRKITRNGCFATSVRTGDAASRLLELTSLAGVPCDVSIPRWYSGNVRKIVGVPDRYSERQLLEQFYGVGVIYVRRQVKHIRNPDGTIGVHPQQAVVLYFRPNARPPERVRLGFVSFTLRPFTSTPTQCVRCQRYFHIARNCNSPLRCKLCGGPHNYRACTRPYNVRCCNCLGRHVASFSGCPTRRSASIAKANTLCDLEKQWWF
ncbi:hypothetical protein HPB50_002099 [Hyalomma asiaticum]|uniref:Uncharacterized protein n=1 Tax=Hyalomma asiaticum TaxID=266040 RepID=A0ACB7RLX4_HYAAI|nr:hypothetical protein HPB50_002099 [Hyalomma asiaticum]